MTTHQLDQFILSTVNSSWQKVAMVIAKALTEPGVGLPEASNDAEAVASRIEALIARGELEVHGNPSKWRYSEIRRATHAAGAA